MVSKILLSLLYQNNNKMRLIKNRWYQLNGESTMWFYTGKTTLGYRFITDLSGSCIFLGINRLIAAEPKIVSKKLAKSFLVSK